MTLKIVMKQFFLIHKELSFYFLLDFMRISSRSAGFSYNQYFSWVHLIYFLLLNYIFSKRTSLQAVVRPVFQNKEVNTSQSNSQNVHSTVSLGLSEWFSPAEPDGCHHIWSGVRISICPWRWETGHYLQKLVKSRTIPNTLLWKVQLWCHTLLSRASLPLMLSSGVCMCVSLSFFF